MLLYKVAHRSLVTDRLCVHTYDISIDPSTGGKATIEANTVATRYLHSSYTLGGKKAQT